MKIGIGTDEFKTEASIYSNSVLTVPHIGLTFVVCFSSL